MPRNNTNFILEWALNCFEDFKFSQDEKLSHSHSYEDIFQRRINLKRQKNKAQFNVILVLSINKQYERTGF